MAAEFFSWLQFTDKKSSVQKNTVAFSISIFFHFLLILIVMNWRWENKAGLKPPIENYVDLGYEQFDEVPKLVETRNDTPKELPTEQPEIKETTSSVSRELQDQSSEVSSLNKEIKENTPTKPTPVSGPVTDVPYYQIKPKYPKEALLSGIEGHVLLKLDIKEDGSVENIRVTGGEKLNVFEMEAKRAVVKWKYKPFLGENGIPIKMENHQVRVDFKLIDEQVVRN